MNGSFLERECYYNYQRWPLPICQSCPEIGHPVPGSWAAGCVVLKWSLRELRQVVKNFIFVLQKPMSGKLCTMWNCKILKYHCCLQPSRSQSASRRGRRRLLSPASLNNRSPPPHPPPPLKKISQTPSDTSQLWGKGRKQNAFHQPNLSFSYMT